jgi:uncharacterized protein (DUF427 family)
VERSGRLVRRGRADLCPPPQPVHQGGRTAFNPPGSDRARRRSPCRFSVTSDGVRDRLPTRYYINPTDVSFDHLVPTETVTECPYKGTTGGYWSARIPDPTTGSVTEYQDLAWMYAFPTRQLLPISGLIAFYNERVDTFLDGEAAA